MFSCQLGSTNGLFRGRDEMLSGRNEAATASLRAFRREWLCVRKRCVFLLLGQPGFEKNGSMLSGKELCQGHSTANCRKLASRAFPGQSRKIICVGKAKLIDSDDTQPCCCIKSTTEHPRVSTHS